MVRAEQKDWFADGEAYEHYVGRWSRPVARLFLSWLSMASALRWLDVGCGTGALTAIILNRADPEHVVGVEPSAGFLSIARKNVEDARVEFRLGDAQALPVADKEVDVAVSGLVLNFVPDKQRALKEMCRAVKPGGTVGAYVWDYSGDMQLMRYFWNGARDLFSDGAERDEGRQFPICKPEALVELFSGSGLNAVDTCALDAPTVRL
jgi:SAM-dependent methyltransferase